MLMMLKDVKPANVLVSKIIPPRCYSLNHLVVMKTCLKIFPQFDVLAWFLIPMHEHMFERSGKLFNKTYMYLGPAV